MTDKQMKAYHRYQRFLRVLLLICGCWHAPSKSGKSTYYWSVCMLPLLFTYGVLNLRISYIFRHHLAIMMKNIGVFISTSGTLLKIAIFLINRRYLINYHGTMSDLFEEELKRDEKVRRVMLAPLRGISTLAYTHSSIMLILIMTYVMPPFVVIIRGIFHLYLPTDYTLPYSRGYGYFWTVPNNFLRHFHLLYEWWVIITQAVTNASVDSAFGFYVYLLASTMRAMTFRLTNPLPNDKYSDVLRVCVTKHLKLMQCRDMLKRIYSVIILWHIVTNAILLCAVIYEAMQLPEISIGIAFHIMSYSVVKLLQTFIYAWYGTIITNADEDFRNGIYFSEWHNSSLDRHIRTNILLMMMQKPMTIKVFSVSIDVVIFTNLVNTTMSYLFLLESISDKNG